MVGQLRTNSWVWLRRQEEEFLKLFNQKISEKKGQ